MTGTQRKGTQALHFLMAKWHAFAGRNTRLPDAIRARAERLLELDVEPLWARVDRKRRGVVLAAFADFIEARPLSPWLVDDEDYFENVQLRVSDGNSIFRPKLFAPDASIRKARYQMVAGEAGIKYRGRALEVELYSRWIDDFQVPGTGSLPFDDLEDKGLQLIESAMLMPRTLQAYLGGSYIDGEYGNPWDVRLGLNWYPFRNKGLRWNNELLYVDDSPVGGLTLPTQVGAEGTVFYSTLEVFF